MEIVRVEELGKTYPGGTVALRGVDFAVQRGEVFCLLGRNGAGKTTLLRILATQLKPTTGKAIVFGQEVVAGAKEIRKRIGVVPQEARPQMLLSAYDHVYYFCLIRGMSRSEARRRTQSIMEELDLWEHRKKLCADLSGGLRQRVIIATALTIEPELVFLDEPSIGLDPIGRRAVWSLIRRMTARGVTVLLTTHYMDEAEMLADRLLIIEKGRVAYIGTVENAKQATGNQMQVIVEPLLATGGDGRQVFTPSSNEEILEVVQRSLLDGHKVTFKPPSLEDAFIKIVGGSIDVENA